MYGLTDIGSLYRSLPPNLQTTENECLGYAIDRQMEKFAGLARRLTIWSDVDNADAGCLDQMALTIRAPYYKSEYDEATKRALIKSAVETRRLAGTRRAVELLLSKAYNDSTYTPWYEYGDDPYYFKVTTDEAMSQDIADLFAAALGSAKAVRSHIRSVEVHRTIDQPYYAGGGFSAVVKPPAIMDGYTTNETVDGEYNASAGTFTSGSRPPAIRDGYITNESMDETTNASTGIFTSGSRPPAIRDGYITNESIDETINIHTGTLLPGYKPPAIRA
jgi:P2-related tail formation protein